MRKLSKLTAAEWADLVAAQLALIMAQALVWTRPRGRLVDGAPAAGDRAGTGDPAALRIALAVDRAASYGIIRPLCLVRALALNRMLESRGIRGSRIRIGVRRADGRFAAHAWVEYRGQVLGDTAEHVGGFAELADVRLAEGR